MTRRGLLHATLAMGVVTGAASGGMGSLIGAAAAAARERARAAAPAVPAEFLDGRVVDGAIVQSLRLVLPDNQVRVALYTVQREGRAWRIAGCLVTTSRVQAA